MKRFEPGMTYKTRSICDHSCIIAITILARTEKTIKASVDGEAKTLRVANLDGVEAVKPWGSYSMAPTIRATHGEAPGIEVTYTAPSYAPEAVRSRYVRADVKGGGYSWCEVGENRRYDLRQGTVEAGSLPEAVREAADELRGKFPGYVVWP